MKSILKRVVNRLHSSLNKQHDVLLTNVFKKDYNKRVLVSYITTPFISGVNDKHTNLLECYTACKIFDELGYIVDVIDYNKFSSSIKYESYEVIYGFGESFEQLFYWQYYSDKGGSIKKIVYGTGCDTVYSNSVSVRRVSEFYNKSTLFCLSSARITNTTWRAQITFSDLVIALGNQYVVDTYSLYNKQQVKSINIFYKDIGKLSLLNKDFKKAKLNFVWWGSSGAIHKGLDLVVDVFARMTNLNLFICGFADEYPFSLYLSEKINSSPNIVNMGFVQVGSQEHIELLMNCIATILPSVSEGNAPGVVNACSAAGLIPLVTKSCGLDIPEISNQFVIDEADEYSIEKSINNIIKLNNTQLLNICIEIQDYFREKHSYRVYEENLRASIMNMIDS